MMETNRAYNSKTLFIQSIAVGISVGAVVYHQAMTELIASGMGLPDNALWVMSVATQIGYAAGLILVLPLGDKWPIRKLSVILMAALGVVLLLQGVVQTLSEMIVLCTLSGGLSVGGQLLIAHAAKNAPPERRAAIVGTLLSALFGGLLFARFLGGWGGQLIGWRAIYGLVGAIALILAILLPGTLQNADERIKQSFRDILRGQVYLLRTMPELRNLAYIGACFFAASNGFWANIGSIAGTTLHWGAATTGLLALASICSLWAPWVVAKLNKRMCLPRVVLLLTGVVILVALITLFGGLFLTSLVVFVAVSDLSVRSIQVLTQQRALAIDPSAASRINSLYLTIFFVGAAVGSWLGGVFTLYAGWHGVFIFSILAPLAGLGFAQAKSLVTRQGNNNDPNSATTRLRS